MVVAAAGVDAAAAAAKDLEGTGRTELLMVATTDLCLVGLRVLGRNLQQQQQQLLLLPSSSS